MSFDLLRSPRVRCRWALVAACLFALMPFQASAVRRVCEAVGPDSAECGITGCTVTQSVECTLEPESSDYAFLAGSRGPGGEGRIQLGRIRGDNSIRREVVAKTEAVDCNKTSQPVMIATGNKVLAQVDFVVPPEEMPLALVRSYDKSLTRTGIFGPR